MHIEHTEHAYRSAWWFAAIVPLILLLNACTSSMSSAADPNGPLTASEGIVIGSALVRIGATRNQTTIRVAPFFLVPAQDIRFSLEGGTYRDTKAVIEDPISLEQDFSLDVAPGREIVFVMKMNAGAHGFFRLVPKGYEEATGRVGIRFTVIPGQVTYIGRVTFDVPEQLPLSKGLPKGFYSLRPVIQVDDALAATIASILATHGHLARPVVTDLMHP